MARISRAFGLFLLFGVLLITALATQRPAPGLAYDPASDRPNGLLLLREWLAEMEYAVGTTGERAFTLGATDMLFVYPGSEPFSGSESELTADWVEQGGTLVLVDIDDNKLRQSFRFTTLSELGQGRLTQTQPLLPDAAAVITGTSLARRIRLPDDSPGVSVLADESDSPRSAAVVLRLGAGWVWLLSSDFALTNQQLIDDRTSAQIVPALLRGVPNGGQIRFDTYHLFGPTSGRAEGGVGSLQEWAYTTPTGWATLFLFVLTGAYLLLQGRRLGPAVPTITQGRRREAAEFVTAMAGLQRRVGTGDSVARQQRARLKQRLGNPWQISADLADDEFVARLVAANPTVDENRVRGILSALANGPDEPRLVRLAQEVDSLTGRRSQPSNLT